MTYRIYLRDPQQRVSDKTNTSDRAAALSAFTTLVSRTDLDGRHLLAVLNYNGKPVAHHDFRQRPDGSPLYADKHWRGRTDHIQWPPMSS